MEYLAETGELFLDPGIVSYTHNEQENNSNQIEEEHNDSAELDSPNSSFLEESSSWSIWLSSMMHRSTSNVKNIPGSLEKKYSDRRSLSRKESLSSSSSVLAKKVTKQCPNGDLFTGLVDAVTGEPVHGKRVYISSGEIYEGPFHGNGINNKRHGYGGINTKSDGSKFIGRFAYDKPINGTYITSEFTYTGSLLEGAAFHGEGGCLAEKNGNVYKGDFQYGLFHGCGLQCTAEFQYKGEFSKGGRHGMGSSSIQMPLLSCITLPCSLEERSAHFEEVECVYKYTGMWVHGVKEGSGSETLMLSRNESLTSTYVGSFHKNKRNGIGELTLFDGTLLEGIWRGDRPIVNAPQSDDDPETTSAKWRITFANGNVYDGGISSFSNNGCVHNSLCNGVDLDSNSFLYGWNASEPVILPHGFGTMCYSQTGDVYNGTFRMGLRHGTGICIYQKTGDQYNGLWLDDKPAYPQYILFPLYHPEVFTVNVAAASVTTSTTYNEASEEEDSSTVLLASIQLVLSLLIEETTQEHQLLDTDDLINDRNTKSLCISSCNNEINENENENVDLVVTHNPKILKRSDGESTPPTISSSSISSLSPTCYYDDDLIDDDDALLDLNIDDTSSMNNVHHVRGMIHHDQKKAIFTMYTRLQE